MSQLNIYVPAKIEKVIRQKARNSKKSLSRYVTDILKKEVPSDDWGDFFEKVCGKWEGEFPEIKRELPEDIVWPND